MMPSVSKLFPVILSGGFGGRLWPVSRAHYPKQFLPLVTERSLLQETAIRLNGLNHLEAPTLICNERHRFIAAEQLHSSEIQPRRIFLEPIGRNTAPAIAIAAWDIAVGDPDGIMLVLPSDHVILHVPSFHRAIQDALQLAQQDYLVTFGVIPTAPKTGYGYIKKGQEIGKNNQFQIEAFVEKPDLNTANKYLASQSYFWNSGIFIFKASVFLEELNRHAPDIYAFSRKTHQSLQQDTDFAWINQADFEQCPSTSIDYAIMEKTERAAVIAVDMGWSDVGSWGALWEVVSKDASGNATNGHVYLKDVSNCFIKSKKEIVAALGIDDLIVIDTDDALLIAHMDKEQEVRDVFKKLM
jgi:mannose-1-phosphate guanylyltransferase/mannose-1-phosphate guanylyltransferase/mannose-6-phosphate isomerase